MTVVLLSFLLVLAAAVTLVIGLLNGGLGLIYVSIACSLGAGVVLAVAVLRSRPRPTATGGPAPLHDESRDTTVVAPSTSVRRQDSSDESAHEPAPRTPVFAGGAAIDDDDDFPIADYDNLKVTDILPLLPELEPAELAVVRTHEANGKNRSRVLGRIEMLSAEQDWDVADDEWEPSSDGGEVVEEPARRERAFVSRRPGLDDADDEDEDEFEAVDDDFDDDDAAGAVDGEAFPIADYDDLKVGEIMPLLPELDADELEMVRDREEAGPARGMIMSRIERLLGTTPSDARAPRPAKSAPRKATTRVVVRKAAAKKASAKAVPTRKAPAKKAAAKKKATTRKAVAKKSTAKRAPAKRATAKKR